MEVKIILDEGAFMPEYAHDTDAGMDLRSPKDAYVLSGSSVVIDTGVHIQIPEGMAGVLFSKSGLNVTHSITSTGLIDSGYNGKIMVKLYNHGWNTRAISKGDKISQLVLIPIAHADFKVVDSFPETERGDNGFGSTGR